MVFERELEKQVAELEEKISVLLSCKNCPENKGGFICQKEYENKCLAQKIQFIKELQEENAELKEFYENEYFQIADRTADEKIKELEKYQTEVTVDDYSPYDENTWGDMHEEWFVPKELVRDLLKESYALSEHRKNQLTKAKELLKRCYENYIYLEPLRSEIEQFLSEVEK